MENDLSLNLRLYGPPGRKYILLSLVKEFKEYWRIPRGGLVLNLIRFYTYEIFI